MSYKRFRNIQLVCSICNFVSFVFLLYYIISSILLGNFLALKKLLPILIVVGVIGFILILLFGRIFCGFLCPIGFFCDIVWKITEKLHLPKLVRNERYMRIIYIFNRIFLGFFICIIVSLLIIIVFFPSLLMKIRIPIFVPIIIGVVMITINSLARRFFCNLCPIGSFIGIFEKANIVKLEKDCVSCKMCGACYEACPMRIKSIYIETKNSDVSSSKCLYCGECIKKCPEDDVLAISICGKKIYKSSKEDFINNQFDGISINNKDSLNG